MRIALINLPNPALAEPWSNYPLGLGYVAASIRKRGYDVTILDLCEGLAYMPEDEFDIYGMQITAPQAHYAAQLAGLIKARNPGAAIVAGGPQTTADYARFLSNPNFDSVVMGEAEFSFFEAVRQYELTGYMDAVYWNPPIKLLDDIPFPSRAIYPRFKENALQTTQLLKGDYTDGGQTTIIASRGCPYSCSFCAPHPRVLRYRSPGNVVAELRSIIDEFGIYQFKWQDDTFTCNRKWVLSLCELIKNELPPTYHRAHTRVNTFDEELAQAMQDAGFKVLCFGIESFSQRILDKNTKAITIDQIESALRIAKKYNFKTVGFLIFGLPGEDRASVTETKAGILRNKKNIDYLNLATFVPLPGTPISKDPAKFDVDIIENSLSEFWIVDHDSNPNVLVKTKGVELEEMQRLKVEMYQFLRDEGYSRPEWKP